MTVRELIKVLEKQEQELDIAYIIKHDFEKSGCLCYVRPIKVQIEIPYRWFTD